jgi:hypothetical protein
MARHHANNGRIYRAVIIESRNGEAFSTEIYGPYDTAAPAKALITSAENGAKNSRNRYRNPAHAYDAHGWIESASVSWAPIEEA